MRFEDLTPEQQAKAKACKDTEELLALAKEEGYEIPDEELQAVGGKAWSGCIDNCNERTWPFADRDSTDARGL